MTSHRGPMNNDGPLSLPRSPFLGSREESRASGCFSASGQRRKEKGGEKGGLQPRVAVAIVVVVGSREKRRTSVSAVLIFPSQSVQYIQGAKEASLSLGEWTFSLKVALTRRTKGSLPGGKERRCTPWRTLKYAEFTPRSREYGRIADKAATARPLPAKRSEDGVAN